MADENPLTWETEPSENYLDEHFLYRGIHMNMWQTWKNPQKIDPNFFMTKRAVEGLSTDWSKYSNPQNTLTNLNSDLTIYGIAEIIVGQFKDVIEEHKFPLTIHHDPTRIETEREPLNRAPEVKLTNSAFADLFHYYNIPMWSTVGSDSHCLDQQSAMEHAFATLLASLDAANLIHDIGYLGQGLVGNPVSIVMCDEIISFVKRFIKGFEINKETLAIDVIREIGPGSEFLSHKHTLKHYKQEQWRPLFLNRDDPETWIKKGVPTYGERVKAQTLKILDTHKPESLKESIQLKLNEILEEAEHQLKDMQFKA